MSPKIGKYSGGPADGSGSDYAAVMALALRGELGMSHQAVKTIIRWTGAGERTVTSWLAGDHGPSGPHLAQLACHSDAVLEAFLVLAGREPVIAQVQLHRVRKQLLAALAVLDRLECTRDDALH